MNINNEDLETFLIQAELINQKVKALAQNRMSPEEFDKLEAARAEDKRKRQEGKKRIQRQKVQKKKQGREGKGITKDFQHFCRFCHREYQLPTPVCLRCNKNTMTLQERQQQLKQMVEVYKDKKKKRQDRKMKWDMWQKTKAMLWKKTSNNYDKWEYFVSDSEQQPEQQPIVPKDDPNFKALQRDMQQRKAMRQKQTKKAKQLKQKGNNFMKQGKYQQAKNMYTLALEHIKDIKSIYTNRALAYIKLGKFKKAVKDCADVIQYMEIFEKVEENKDLVFKAYLRKALAQKQMKNYKEALEDVNKAIGFYPHDKSAELLKKQIEGFIEHSKNVEKLIRQSNKNPQSEVKPKQEVEKQEDQQKMEQNNKQQGGHESDKKFNENDIIKELAQAQLAAQPKPIVQQKPQQVKIVNAPTTETVYKNPIQQIKQRVQNLNQQNITSIFRLLRQKQELVSIFIAAKGIQKCLQQLVNPTNQQYKKEGFLVSVCLRGDGVGQKEVWDFGINKIYKRVQELLSNSGQMNVTKYFILQDIFQVLIPMSLHQKYRIMLNEDTQTFKFLQKTFSLLLPRYKKQPDLFSSLLIYMGNLSSGTSKFRQNFLTPAKLSVLVTSLYEKVLSKKSVNKSILNLKKNIYGLLANLAIGQTHRVKIIQIFNQKQISVENQVPKWDLLVKELKYYKRSQQNFQEYISGLLSLFVNASLGTSLDIDGLAQTINERFISNPSTFSAEIINRCLLVLSRIKYTNTSIFKKLLKNFETHLQTLKKMKKDKNPMQQIVRLLNIMYNPIEGQQKFSYPIPQNLLNQIKSYISSYDNGQVLFCNSCNMFSIILDTNTEFSKKMYIELKPHMKFLIDVAKDKVGNWRKNASILLAKLSLNAECKAELEKHHGMDVLKSIAQFVKQK